MIKEEKMRYEEIVVNHKILEEFEAEMNEVATMCDFERLKEIAENTRDPEVIWAWLHNPNVDEQLFECVRMELSKWIIISEGFKFEKGRTDILEVTSKKTHYVLVNE